jgi:hypothetical protein
MKKSGFLAFPHITILFYLLISGFIVGHSQKTSLTLSENAWHVQELNGAIGNFYSPSSFKQSIIYINDGAVAAVQFNKDEWGAVRISQDGKVIWQLKVSGPIAGIAKKDNDILLFYTDEEIKNRIRAEGLSTKVNALLINDITGKKIQEKVVFDNGSIAFIDYRVLTRVDGSFVNLVVRVSNFEKDRIDPDKERKERLTTSKLSLLDIQRDLSVKTSDIRAAGKEGLFLGSQLGKGDDLFFCSILDGQLMVERFLQSGAPSGKLSTPLAIKTTRGIVQPVISINPHNLDEVFVGLHYKSESRDITNQVFGFNFSTKKVGSTGEDDLGKAFKKSLELNEIKDLQSGSLVDMEALTVIDVVVTEKKVAVIKEIQFTESSSVNSGGIWFRNDVLIVSIYDRQWKLLQTIGLDKKYEANMPVGRSVGIKPIGEKLHFVMSAVEGALKYATVYAVIDLDNLKLESYSMLDKKGLPKIQAIEGGASLWFPDGVLIEYFDAKGGPFRRKDFYSTWQKIRF